MVDGDGNRISGLPGAALGAVQRVQKAASRGRTSARNEGESHDEADQQGSFLLDDPHVRQGPAAACRTGWAAT